MTNDQVNLVRQRPSKVAQKRLLQWHFRLGHVAFSTVVKRGFLGCSATGTDADQRPLCASCQLGKGKRLSSGGMHHPRNHESEGGRQDRVLEPGQVVAMDQYESSLRGHTEQSMGCERESNRYCGGTLFYDGATLKIFVRHQTSTSLTAMETIQSKQMFEREARSEGVMIQSYRSDNSIFTTKEFLVLLVLEQEKPVKVSSFLVLVQTIQMAPLRIGARFKSSTILHRYGKGNAASDHALQCRDCGTSGATRISYPKDRSKGLKLNLLLRGLIRPLAQVRVLAPRGQFLDCP